MKSIFMFLFLLNFNLCFSQNLKIYHLNISDKISIDGKLDETVWSKADSIPNLTMVEPIEGSIPTFKTVVKVLADNEDIILGIKCYDPEPLKILAYSKSRDASLGNEDRIKFVLDTYLDKRSGYIFAVNPNGTRYDALVSNFGESENSNWDGIWDAKTNIDEDGWTIEIIIPIRTLSFLTNTAEWGFNIERRIQRILEIDRWIGIKRDYQVGQVAQAGRITNLPQFDLGIGLTSKVSLLSKTQKSFNQNSNTKLDWSLDFTEKVTPDISAQITINTDFAETEVDSRQTNLTRFSIFFPEKRGFFLEGSNIFDFGLGLGSDVVPFYSRRIGLYGGNKIPIIFGSKINGKLNNTDFGALITRTDAVVNIIPISTMGSFRIKQNVLEESSFGIIGTFGDPEGKNNIWLLGADFTYKTSKFFYDKNFLAGIWGLYNSNPNFTGDNSAIGLKLDYPNDLWDIALTVKRIGDTFSPSLGFVPRKGIISYSFGADYMPRPDWGNIRQFFFESSFSLVTNLQHHWESYRVFTAPIHFLLESGDRFEFNIAPQGENLPINFEIEDGIILKSGSYDWWRYRVEFETATKRIINGQATWWFGSFYNGNLDQVELELNLRPSSSVNFTFSYKKNIVRLPAGNFTQDLWGGKLQFSLTPNFELSSFVQYDNESKSLGTNTRIRWTFDLLGDLFIVYNHNINKIESDVWQYQSNQFTIKLSYGFWF